MTIMLYKLKMISRNIKPTFKFPSTMLQYCTAQRANTVSARLLIFLDSFSVVYLCAFLFDLPACGNIRR